MLVRVALFQNGVSSIGIRLWMCPKVGEIEVRYIFSVSEFQFKILVWHRYVGGVGIRV